MPKKSVTPKIVYQATDVLLAACCLDLPNAQSSHGLKYPVTWIPIALAVAWVIDSDGWPSSTCTLLIFFFQGAVADCTLPSSVSWRKLTLATQPS